MFSDLELTDGFVAAACAGDVADRNRLMSLIGPRVRAMILVRLAPTASQLESVEDLTQQALLALIEGLAQLRTRTVEALRSYVSIIAERQVANFLRNQANGPGHRRPANVDRLLTDASASGVFTSLLASSGLNPRSAAARAELTRRLVAELGVLKPEHREVIVLSFFDQLHIAEVAERLGINRPAASMLLMRAIKALRRRMTGAADKEGGNVSVS